MDNSSHNIILHIFIIYRGFWICLFGCYRFAYANNRNYSIIYSSNIYDHCYNTESDKKIERIYDTYISFCWSDLK